MINFVHFTCSPGGVEVLLPSIIRNMPSWQFSSFIIRPPKDDIVSIYNGTSVCLEYGSHSNINAFWRLYNYSRKRKKEIFHVYNIGPLFLLALRLAGVNRLVYSIHGTVYWKTSREKFLRKILWWASINRKKFLFISNSDYSRKVFLDKINSRITIEPVYNPIDLNRFSLSERKMAQDTPEKILYTGRLTKGKGLEKWIEYALFIHEKYPAIKFELYGDGPLKEYLKSTIIKLKADDYIKIMGYRKEIESVYKSGDLLLFLSEKESFGNVIVESILCGTPVIVSDIPSMKEIFENFPDFIIASGGNQTDAILRKIDDYPNLKKLCLLAAEEFRTRFQMEQHLEKLSKVYEVFNS